MRSFVLFMVNPNKSAKDQIIMQNALGEPTYIYRLLYVRFLLFPEFLIVST